MEKIVLQLSLEEVQTLRDLTRTWTKEWEDSPQGQKDWKLEISSDGEMHLWCGPHGLSSTEAVQ